MKPKNQNKSYLFLAVLFLIGLSVFSKTKKKPNLLMLKIRNELNKNVNEFVSIEVF